MRASLSLAVILGLSSPALAAFSVPPPSPSCQQAVAAAEQTHAIPTGLLSAIAQVESGRRDPATGAVAPWPWTINADGDGEFFTTKSQAVQFARTSDAHDIDVGCMQISLLHHPNAFRNLEEAFDPVANAQYAATYLRQLYLQTNDWTAAAALYHSATPALAADYRRKVLAVWTRDPAQAPGASPIARTWAATLGSPFGGAALGMAAPTHVFAPAPAPVLTGQSTPGRGLAAYRAAPIPIASFRHG